MPRGVSNVTAENAMDAESSVLPEVHLSDVQISEEPEESRAMPLHRRVIGAWSDMRVSTRTLIDEKPSEARLIFFVLLSDVIFFLARTLSLVVAPAAVTEDKLPLNIALWLIGVFVLRTATLYVFSGMIGFIGRSLGGTGSWRDTRTAVFWASLVAAPVGVLGALLGAGLGHLSEFMPIFTTAPFVIGPLVLGPVAFVWFISASVAEAHGTKRTSLVFIAFSVLAIFVAIGLIAVAAQL